MAIILAAGTGVRLQAVHSEQPKGFVEVGGGPIIARSVAALRRAGVREFVFVVGWRGSVYRSWCATECPGALCVENVDFATTGSLRSLVLGCAVVPGRKVVVVESDLLFEQRAPDCLLAAATENTVLLSDFTDSRDEVWAYAQADDPTRLRFLTKKKSMIEGGPVGELVGLSLFSETLVGQLGVAARALPATAHYEDGLNAVSSALPVSLLRVPGLVWCEIDDPQHLARARASVWPRVVDAEARYDRTQVC